MPLRALVRIGPAAIEGVPVNRLPVFRDRPRIFAHQVRLDFLDGFGARQRAAFGDGFAQTDDAGVGMYLQEQPARLDQYGLELGDLEIVFCRDRSIAVALLLRIKSFG
jgi:hypothetical protein